MEYLLCGPSRSYFYTFSYLNYFFKYEDTKKSKMIYEEILHDELKNGMPDDIVSKGKTLLIKD